MEVPINKEKKHNNHEHINSEKKKIILDNVVVLNVGGTTFQTLTTTLSKFEGTFFQGILDSEPQKEYFIDRDPVVFQSVLYFLRNGKIELFGNASIEAVYNELDYFSIPFIPEPKRVPIDGVVYQCNPVGAGRWLFPGYVHASGNNHFYIYDAEVLQVLLSLGFFQNYVGVANAPNRVLPLILTFSEGMKKFRETGYIFHSPSNYFHKEQGMDTHFYSFSLK